MKKLVIFGDSVMKGVTLENDRYGLCASRDFDSIAAHGIEVFNRSKMGATVDKGVAALERSGLPDTDSTVLTEYGGNDCDYDWDAVSNDPSGEYLSKTPMNVFIETYRSLLARLTESGAKVFVSTLLPVDAEKYISWISKNRSRENILAWLGDVSMLARWQETYNNAVVALAREMQCEIIDIRTPFLLSHDFKSLLCDDGIHPTQAGHDLIEKTMHSRITAF